MSRTTLSPQSGLKFFILSVLFFSSAAFAQLYDGANLQATDLQSLAAMVAPGDVVVIGEVHDSIPHHKNEVALIQALQAAGLRVNVGMEFFTYTSQSDVDLYLRGELDEAEFLRRMEWGQGIPFDLYRQQVRAPLAHGGWTWALNMDRAVTSKISQRGFDSLDENDKALLPPAFTVGRAPYFERFQEVMGGHAPAEKVHDYFVAQSLWDDTMAWQARLRQTQDPDSVLVIIVGDFHVAWGGGLPDRLMARGDGRVVTISQVQSADAVAVDPRYGPRGTYIWLAQ